MAERFSLSVNSQTEYADDTEVVPPSGSKMEERPLRRPQCAK
jgi:hypothetical protein